VLEDLSISGSPATWAGQAITAYYKHHANVIIAEANHGGDMVLQTLATQDAKVATKKVWASQGKYARAEPVSALYEQGRVHHVGMFAALEDQMCNWVPGEGMPSPNELDACTWCLTDLMLGVHIPTDMSLETLADLRQRPLSARTAHIPGARQSRSAPAEPSRSEVEDMVRARWSVNDPYDDDEGY
jgi:hypothetical protein